MSLPRQGTTVSPPHTMVWGVRMRSEEPDTRPSTTRGRPRRGGGGCVGDARARGIPTSVSWQVVHPGWIPWKETSNHKMMCNLVHPNARACCESHGCATRMWNSCPASAFDCRNHTCMLSPFCICIWAHCQRPWCLIPNDARTLHTSKNEGTTWSSPPFFLFHPSSMQLVWKQRLQQTSNHAILSKL